MFGASYKYVKKALKESEGVGKIIDKSSQKGVFGIILLGLLS